MDIQILAYQFYDYSLYIRGYSKSTIKRYKYVIDLYCRFTQVTDISEVTNDNVRALFYHGRTHRKWSPNTFIVFYKSFKVFFKWCIKEGFLKINPVEDIELPKLEQKLPVLVTEQDALRLLEIVYNYPYEYKFVRYRNHALFATFIFTGLRRAELLNLKFADVDLENFSIFVRQGKGGKDRYVPISSTLARILSRYIIERKRLNKTCPEFFVSSNRNCGFTINGLKHLVEIIKKASGIKFSVHKLRHTFATLMLEGGCDLVTVSRMLGHSTIQMTTRYTATSTKFLRSEITKHPLNNLLR